MQERLLVCSEYFEHGPVLLLVERIEQVKGVLHVKQERKENATVCKKIGEHHQMMAPGIHFFAIDTGEEMF